MSNYGQPSSSPPDPWNDKTVSYPPPPSSGPPAYQPGSAAPAYPANPQPYGQQPAYEPTQYQPSYQQPGYPQQPGYDQGYGQAQYPAPKKSHTVTILVIVLAVVVLGAIAAGVLLYQRNGSSGTASAPPANVGECVVSNGQPAPNISLNKAACGPGSFKILKIVGGTSDQAACQSVAGANTYFAYKWASDPTKSYVLCLQSQ